MTSPATMTLYDGCTAIGELSTTVPARWRGREFAMVALPVYDSACRSTYRLPSAAFWSFLPESRGSHNDLDKNLCRPRLHSRRRPLRIYDRHEPLQCHPMAD